MATLTELRAGLKARLDTIPGLRAYAVMPPKPEPPAAAPLPGSWEYGMDFDSMTVWQFEVWVYVNPADLGRAQERFDEYMAPSGTYSVAAAINADTTLGIAGVCAKVTGARNYAQLVDVAGSQLLGGALQVEVYAP